MRQLHRIKNKIMSNTIQFSGTIPEHYENILTPFLFDPFSADLMVRIDFSTAQNVLELACGTGSVTRRLLEHLPAGSSLVATDLQQGMLDVAKQQLTAPNISWQLVDMTQIPYSDDSFDLIICQFGLMLVPDKLKALAEMHRVLKKGGRLVFSVWGDIENNPVWNISGKVMASLLGANPMLQDPGPFSLSAENETLQLLTQAGFTDTKATLVKQTGEIANAALAARGFIQGLPVFSVISQKDPALIEQIQEALEPQLIDKLGDLPMRSALHAWVFEISK
jgi:SAM-dependent methyltransferase